MVIEEFEKDSNSSGVFGYGYKGVLSLFGVSILSVSCVLCWIVYSKVSNTHVDSSALIDFFTDYYVPGVSEAKISSKDSRFANVPVFYRGRMVQKELFSGTEENINLESSDGASVCLKRFNEVTRFCLDGKLYDALANGVKLTDDYSDVQYSLTNLKEDVSLSDRLVAYQIIRNVLIAHEVKDMEILKQSLDCLISKCGWNEEMLSSGILTDNIPLVFSEYFEMFAFERNQFKDFILSMCREVSS